MTNWENMTPEDEQRIVDNASKLKGFFSPIRAAYGIPENVPIIEELDRRFERMEAELSNETERCRAAICNYLDIHEVDHLTGPELDAVIRRVLEPTK